MTRGAPRSEYLRAHSNTREPGVRPSTRLHKTRPTGGAVSLTSPTTHRGETSMDRTQSTTTPRRVLPMPRYAPGEGEMVRSESGEFVRRDDVLLMLAFLRSTVADSVA